MDRARPVAIVTGAGRGIGRTTALALAREGHAVALAGRHFESLKATAADASAEYGPMLPIACDVADEASVASLFARTLEAFGRLDLLFNNAGLAAPPLPIEDLTLEQWTRVVEVNLTGAFLCTREAIRVMKAQRPRGGRIINNGSVSAYTLRPDSAPFTATKHAMTGLTKSTALDGRKYDICCGQIDIGDAATDMTARMKHGVPQANGPLAPKPSLGVDDIARAVVYMATLPLDANVQFVTVRPPKMPFGRG